MLNLALQRKCLRQVKLTQLRGRFHMVLKPDLHKPKIASIPVFSNKYFKLSRFGLHIIVMITSPGSMVLIFRKEIFAIDILKVFTVQILFEASLQACSAMIMIMTIANEKTILHKHFELVLLKMLDG